MQVVGDELVEAVAAFVNEVEVDDAARIFDLAADGLDGLAVAREDGPQAALHLRVSGRLFERAPGQKPDDVLDELLLGVLDDLHQSQRRLLQLDGLRGRLVLGAVDDVRPVDERAEVGGVKPNRSRATRAINSVQDLLPASQNFWPEGSARKCASSSG